MSDVLRLDPAGVTAMSRCLHADQFCPWFALFRLTTSLEAHVVYEVENRG